MKREGFPALANTADVVSIPLAGLSATLEKIKQNRSQVKRVLKSEVEALRYLREDAAGSTEIIRKRFAMDDAMARESYAVVVNAFSKDGRVDQTGVENLLEIERKAGLPGKVTVADVADISIAEEVLKELIPGR